MRRGHNSFAVRGWVALFVVTLAGFALVGLLSPSRFVELPFAGSERRVRAIIAAWSEAEVGDARRALDADYGLILAYVALLASACFWRAGWEPPGRERRGYWHLPACFAAIAALGGVADLTENILLERAITFFRRGVSLPDARFLQAAAFAKIGCAAIVIGYLVHLLPQRLAPPLGGALFGPPTVRPPFLREAGQPHPWQPPADGVRKGVCLGGAGPVAAAYGSGALDGLHARGELAGSEYVAVAGSAAGRVLTRPATLDADGRRSTNSSPYGRALAGVVVNVALVWLVLFCVARPVGWLISSDSLHPELRAREPYVSIRRPPTVGSTEVTVLPGSGPGADARFTLTIGWEDARLRLEGREVRSRNVRAPARASREGIIAFDDGRLRVVQQPRIELDTEAVGEVFNGVAGRPSVRVDAQPVFALAGVTQITPASDIDPDLLADQVELVKPPELVEVAGMRGRPPPHWDGAMVAVPVVAGLISLLAFGLGAALDGAGAGPFGVPLRWLGRASGWAAVAAGAVALAVPWAVREVPRWWHERVGALVGVDGDTVTRGSSALDGVPAALALAVLGWVACAGVRQTTRARVPAPGRTTSGWTRGATTWLRRLRPALAGAVVVGAGCFTFVDLVEIAAANGPFGHLAGLGIGLQPLADAARWLLAVAVLVVLWRVVDAHAGARLAGEVGPAGGPAVRARDDGDGEGGEDARAGEGADALNGERLFSNLRDYGATELVFCGAAHVRPGPGGTPLAVPMTFSSSVYGGPNVGYVDMPAALAALGPARRGDLDPAELARTAAAVGRLGSSWLEVLANRGRGAWLAHPEWLSRFIELERETMALAAPPDADRSGATDDNETAPPGLPTWTDRPGWPTLFAEVAGRLGWSRRYLSVAGADAYDGLGLVELLRRGCTEIVCVVSPATLGTESGEGWADLANAVARARADLGIDIDLPNPDRTSNTGNTGHAARTGRAGNTGIVGTIRYPPSARHDGRIVTGRLLVVGLAPPTAQGWEVTALATTFQEATDRRANRGPTAQARWETAVSREGYRAASHAVDGLEWRLHTQRSAGAGDVGKNPSR